MATSRFPTPPATPSNEPIKTANAVNCSGPSDLVRIRGLPWGAGKQEINSFFSPLELHPVHAVTLVNGPGGKPTGEAFVRFASVDAASRAAEYNRHLCGKRYIEVFPATSQELDISVQRQGVRDFSDGVLRCRGLPFNCSVSDIAGFFSDYGVKEENVSLGVHLTGQFQGNPNGEAWVKFKNEATAKIALSERNLSRIGSRYVELYLSSEAERRQFQSLAPPNKGRPSVDNMRGGSAANPRHNGHRTQRPEKPLNLTNCDRWLRARGLPFSCGPEDVAAFFSGHAVSANDVIMCNGPDRRPTGVALIRFQSAQAAEAARQSRHRQQIRNRYVELFTAGSEDLAMYQAHHSPQPRQRGKPDENGFGHDPPGNCILMEFACTPHECQAQWGFACGPSTYLPGSFASTGGNNCNGGQIVGQNLLYQDANWNSNIPVPGQCMNYSPNAPYDPMYKPSAYQVGVMDFPVELGREDSSWLRMRGSPVDATASDISSLFAEFGVSKDDVFICRSENEDEGFEVFLRFDGPAIADAARAHFDRQPKGDACILLLPCLPQESSTPFPISFEQGPASVGATPGSPCSPCSTPPFARPVPLIDTTLVCQTTALMECQLGEASQHGHLGSHNVIVNGCSAQGIPMPPACNGFPVPQLPGVPPSPSSADGGIQVFNSNGAAIGFLAYGIPTSPQCNGTGSAYTLGNLY